MILIVTLKTEDRHVLLASYLRIGIEFIEAKNKKELTENIKAYFNRHKEDYLIIQKVKKEQILADLNVKFVFYYILNQNKELYYTEFIFPVEKVFNDEEINRLAESVYEFSEKISSYAKIPKPKRVKKLYSKEIKTFKKVLNEHS